MIKIEHIEVFNFEGAIRGLRNPMNSWDKSDSEERYWCNCLGPEEEPHYCNWCGYDLCHPYDGDPVYVVGENDLDLMRRLYKAGTEHRTYARLIQVSMDITAPLYWWKEADRYSIGKSQISTSTMHKIHAKEFTLDDFSCDHLEDFGGYENKAMFHEWFVDTLDKLNIARQLYLSTGDKRYWWQLIQLLPSSYNQKRTIMMSYEVVFKMIKERTGHKLDEWCELVEILKDLPYVREIMEDDDESEK